MATATRSVDTAATSRTISRYDKPTTVGLLTPSHTSNVAVTIASAARAPAMCHNSASGRRRVGLVGFVTVRSLASGAGRRLRS